MDRISLIKGDITKLDIDAIVNAANTSLLGGGGVDGAIHRAAGPQLLEACRKLNGCPTGEARLTPGFNLPARYVIHTVGPVWHDGKDQEGELLESCYFNSLRIATDKGLSSIAFPNISTGVYRFPKELAGEIAVQTVRKYLANNELPAEVVFVAFDDENYAIYKSLLG